MHPGQLSVWKMVGIFFWEWALVSYMLCLSGFLSLVGGVPTFCSGYFTAIILTGSEVWIPHSREVKIIFLFFSFSFSYRVFNKFNTRHIYINSFVNETYLPLVFSFCWFHHLHDVHSSCEDLQTAHSRFATWIKSGPD